MRSSVEKLDLGLNIFYNSQLATNDPVAQRSAATLKAWRSAGKIKTTTSGVFSLFMGKPGALTSTETLLTADEITVYEDVADAAGPDAPAYWAMLVGHEGVHASLRSKDLDSEMLAWPLQLDLYDELCKGTVTVDKASYGITSPKRFGSLVAANSARKTNQLIDWMLQTNAGYQAHADAAWIVKTFNSWGGIHNRYPEVAALYLKKLAAEKTPVYDEFALKTLELYLPALSTPADCLVVTESAGQTLREALQRYSFRAGKPGFARIEALEKKHGIKLRHMASGELDYLAQKKLGF